MKIEELVKRLRGYAFNLFGKDRGDNCLDEAADKLEELAAERQGVINNIPMDYLQRHDASGATGPTSNLSLVAAMRDYAEARWKLIDRLAEAKREREALMEALKKDPHSVWWRDYYEWLEARNAGGGDVG